MSTLGQSAALSVVMLFLQGCGCMTHVTVTNQTEVQMLADISLPHPGHGALREHCQFTVLLEPGQTWNSRQTTRRDRLELPTGPHENVLLRLINLDAEGWPARVFSVGIEEAGHVFISGTWDVLRVTAEDRWGNELQVWLDAPERWFPQRRRPREEAPDAPLLPRP